MKIKKISLNTVKNFVSGWGRPQWGELTALHQTPNWCVGGEHPSRLHPGVLALRSVIALASLLPFYITFSHHSQILKMARHISFESLSSENSDGQRDCHTHTHTHTHHTHRAYRSNYRTKDVRNKPSKETSRRRRYCTWCRPILRERINALGGLMSWISPSVLRRVSIHTSLLHH